MVFIFSKKLPMLKLRISSINVKRLSIGEIPLPDVTGSKQIFELDLSAPSLEPSSAD
jgi:hypothetical protein